MNFYCSFFYYFNKYQGILFYVKNSFLSSIIILSNKEAMLKVINTNYKLLWKLLNIYFNFKKIIAFKKGKLQIYYSCSCNIRTRKIHKPGSVD